MTSFDLWQTISDSTPLDLDTLSPSSRPTEEGTLHTPTESLFSPTPSYDIEPVSHLFDGVTLLSLDISLNSTGYFISTEDSLYSGCLPPLPSFEDSPHAETLLRRSLIPTLLESAPFLKDLHLDHMAWEDSFVGRSAKVARQLYALNTAPDEAILDRVLLVDKAHRVNNVTWKRVLISYASADSLNKFTHKKKVQDVLRLIPWDSTQSCYDFLESFHLPSTGFQDRLDAFGVALSILLRPFVEAKKHSRKHGKLRGRVLTTPEDLNVFPSSNIYEFSTRPSAPNLVRHLSELPPSSIIVLRNVRIGALHKTLNLPFNPNPADYLFYLEDKK